MERFMEKSPHISAYHGLRYGTPWGYHTCMLNPLRRVAYLGLLCPSICGAGSQELIVAHVRFAHGSFVVENRTERAYICDGA